MLPKVGSASMAQSGVGCDGTPASASNEAADCTQEVVEDSWWKTPSGKHIGCVWATVQALQAARQHILRRGDI